MNSKHKQPPPRWLKCPRKGILVAGKFLPFKTPLSEDYDDEVPEEHRFPPSMLISSLLGQRLKMGLWIDLTNTNRFYDSKEIEKHGIRYMKMACKGRDECPTTEQTDLFIRECQKFMNSNPLEIIGVHCTHGFNRTGFLIVAYLIQMLHYSLEAAVLMFRKCRDPGIYKKDYMQMLQARYGDEMGIPETPLRPSWCNEYDDDDLDDDGISVNEENGLHKGNSPKKRRREFQKENPVFMEGVKGVDVVSKSEKIQEIQRLCQDMCGWKSSGFPGSQPVSMDIQNIKFLSQKAYKVSWKADGTRYMMLINGKEEVYFVDRDNAVYQVTGLTFPKRKNVDEHLSGTLLDGEMIIDKVDGINVPRYLIYDIIKFETQDVGKTDFERRLLCIRREIVEVRSKAMQEGRINKADEPFSIRAKDFWDVCTARRLLEPKFTSAVGHEIDGLIFQPVPDTYESGPCPSVLKWKPPHLNSVDFKLVITEQQKPGMLRERIGNLYVGGLDRPFALMKVTKELRNYDKKIIECKFEGGQWKFMRERTDKSFPNGYKTAQAVCRSIRDPVTEERLICFIDQHRWRHPGKHTADGFVIPGEPAKKRAS